MEGKQNFQTGFGGSPRATHTTSPWPDQTRMNRHMCRCGRIFPKAPTLSIFLVSSQRAKVHSSLMDVGQRKLFHNTCITKIKEKKIFFYILNPIKTNIVPISWICISILDVHFSTTSFLILVSGSPSRLLKASRGLQQGAPSPLFIHDCGEGVGCLLSESQRPDMINSFEACINEEAIMNQHFATIPYVYLGKKRGGYITSTRILRCF